jgi:hypothetical protein
MLPSLVPPLIHRQPLNLINHAWLYPEAHVQRTIFEMGLPDMHNTKGTSVTVFRNLQLRRQPCGPAPQAARVHAVPDRVEAACERASPARRDVLQPQQRAIHSHAHRCRYAADIAHVLHGPTNTGLPLSHFWTVTFDHLLGRACVSLQWVFHRSTPDIMPSFERCSTLRLLIADLESRMGTHEALMEVRRALSVGGPCPARPPLSCPPTDRKDDSDYGKGKESCDGASSDDSHRGRGRGRGRGVCLSGVSSALLM